MSDLISRQAAIDALDRIFDRCEEIEAHLPEGDPDRTGYKMYPDYMTVWKYLHQLPSAQPEREKGKWTPAYSDCDDDVWVVWKCSKCGYVRKKGWDHTNDGEKPGALFCEMCNADMRGEQDADTEV